MSQHESDTRETLLQDLESLKDALTPNDGSVTDNQLNIPVLKQVVGRSTTLQERQHNPFLASKELETLISHRNEAEAKAAEQLAQATAASSLFDQPQLFGNAQQSTTDNHEQPDIDQLSKELNRRIPGLVNSVLKKHLPSIQKELNDEVTKLAEQLLKQKP